MLLSDKNSTSTFWQNPSAYSLYNDMQNAQGITGSTWFRRTFDPQGANMIFNAQEAQTARDFNALEAQKTRDFNALEAQKTRDFNAKQSQLAREWEEKMSNTAYSRAIKDLRANGLNPYLVMSGGASTPSGQVLSGAMASSPTAYGSQASASGSGNATALASSLNSASNVIGTVWNVVKSAMLIAKYGL